MKLVKPTESSGVELELLRHLAPAEAVLGLDLRFVHRVRHQVVEDVGLVMLVTLRAHAVDDDVVVRVIHIMAGIVLCNAKIKNVVRSRRRFVQISNSFAIASSQPQGKLVATVY